ncbi:MAG: hypothetical protein M3Y45_00165 [Actinomycetota bacterium]|nr:hypothetical protein [Actinomycetota bacterium]
MTAAGPIAPRAHRRGDMRPTDVLGAFFLCGLLFLAAAAVTGVIQAMSPWAWGRWLALHLAFFGGVSQLVLGASQFFAAAFLATDPPPRRLVRAQLLCWNAGAILLALAVPLRTDAPIWIAVVLLVGGLLAWARALAVMRGRSLSRNPWATRWYEASAGFFAVGIFAGAILSQGLSWSHGYLLGAHIVLNLAGWFGTAIVGTLHTFYPSLTQTTLRFPRLQPVTFRLWVAGVASLAIGYAWTIEPVAIGGWIVLGAGAVALLVNLIACRIESQASLSLAARVVGVAQLFLPAGIAVLAVAAIVDGPVWSFAGSTRVAAGTLLVAGWVGLTVLGSLLHLLAITVRVRNFTRPMPKARPALDRGLAGLAALGVAGLAATQLLDADLPGQAARAILLVAYLVLAAKVASLGIGVLRHARSEV